VQYNARCAKCRTGLLRGSGGEPQSDLSSQSRTAVNAQHLDNAGGSRRAGPSRANGPERHRRPRPGPSHPCRPFLPQWSRRHERQARGQRPRRNRWVPRRGRASSPLRPPGQLPRPQGPVAERRSPPCRPLTCSFRLATGGTSTPTTTPPTSALATGSCAIQVTSSYLAASSGPVRSACFLRVRLSRSDAQAAWGMTPLA
jgi:hypothetical protein